MTTIYYHPMSFPALGPVFGAEAMGIKYDKKVVDLMQGEQKTESYLAINPYGKVPALVDGDFKLSEGNAILRYLARRENSALYSGDAQAQAKIDQWMDFIVQHIRVNVGRVQFNRVLAPMFGRESDQSSIDLGLEFLAQNLPQVEAQLSATNYLCGDDMTLADIVLLASLEPSEMAGLDLSPYPALQAWLTSAREETFYTNVHSHFGAELGR
jgi:glutathione S-transferase